MLTYPPFAASSQLKDAARNHPPLSLQMKGSGVALLQGGLVQRGIPLPVTMKKGAPDGSFGPETLEGVKTFQRQNKLSPVDGIAGHDTIALLDSLLAKAAGPVPPSPMGPPSSPVDHDYEIGTRDPPTRHDPGAGPWNSKPKQVSYIALKQSILDVLPESVFIIGLDAAMNMQHYLDATGTDQTINLDKMVNDVRSAKARYQIEVAQMQRFVETLPLGSANPITSKTVEGGYNQQHENTNWFFAIGGYSTWGKGFATVSGDRAQPIYSVDFEYKFYDRYNWDAGKSVTFHGITVTDKFMGEFHRQGLAREYDCRGSFKRQFTWKKGQSVTQAELDGPGGRS